MKKNKNFEVIAIISIVLLTLLFIFIYKIIDISNKKNSYTIIFNPYSILECSKWNCMDSSSKLDEYNNKEYEILVNGVSLGKNKVFYNDRNSKLYVFDKDMKNIYDGIDNILIYNGNINISQYNYELNEISDYRILKKLKDITKLDISLDQVKYISYDLDNDNSNEIIYIINSGFSTTPLFNALVYNKNNKYKLIVKEENTDVLKHSILSINNLIDIYNDNKIEIVISKTYYDQIGTCNQIYRLKNNKYKSINKCEIVN